jgi:L-alanine-DL-glutamate epimerase-like enolase superfamily enzyme
MKNIKLSWYPYTLELKHTFNIAMNSRRSTPAVMVEVDYDGLVGYGEASLPPYLPEDQKSVNDFLGKINLSGYDDITNLNYILQDIDKILPGNTAAKASIDIALHDLAGKIKGLPVYKLYNVDKKKVYTSFTIGIDTSEVILQKLKEADNFKFLKVKLGSNSDREIISIIRTVTDKPIFADANQGWSDREGALDLIQWLNERNVVLIEQPFLKTNLVDTAWLTERSPIPIIADEAVQRLSDIQLLQDIYSGINIKLMKSTGILEAYKMIRRARELGLKVMLGCMTETSCAISAAAQLSSLADWVDMDGNILIKNDLFKGVNGADGTIFPNDLPGLGIIKT